MATNMIQIKRSIIDNDNDNRAEKYDMKPI
jgi:hypothetical protein